MFAWFRRRRLVKQIDAALTDGKLSEDEFATVMTSAGTLRLCETETHHLLSGKLREIARQKIQVVLDRAFATNRFSPADEAEMRQIAKDLKLTFDMDLSPLASRRFLWEFENGHRPKPGPIVADINLHRGEQCFHACEATWSQVKTVRKREGYVGGAVRFRLAKNVSFSVGRAVPVTSSSEQMLPISDGWLYVTSHRLLFVGDRRSTETKFRSIATVQRYTDAVEIVRTRGMPDIYLLDSLNAELVPATLSTVL